MPGMLLRYQSRRGTRVAPEEGIGGCFYCFVKGFVPPVAGVAESAFDEGTLRVGRSARKSRIRRFLRSAKSSGCQVGAANCVQSLGNSESGESNPNHRRKAAR